MDLSDLFENKEVVDYPVFFLKRNGLDPREPSGREGRYNGEGTNAHYFADNLKACWHEILANNPTATQSDYSAYETPLTGTFVDVGRLEGTRYSQPRKNGGWEPTRELSDEIFRACPEATGFRYASSPAIQSGQAGTCFCAFTEKFNLREKEVKKLPSWSV